MNDIFISYSRGDRPRAEMLANELKGQGWSVFWDLMIPTGKSFRKIITEELSQARCVIVLWSNTSVGSDWVLDEADVAKQKGILFPVLIEKVQPPIGFRNLQTTDLSTWDGKKRAQLVNPMQSLLSDLIRSLGPPRDQGLEKGWFATGDSPGDYEMGSDGGGGYIGYIKSRVRPAGFGTLMTMIEANPYRGKRLEMTGYAKSTSVGGWAGLWMRIDGPLQELLGFDNMHDRPIIGTTSWTKIRIVLEVPAESSRIAYGVVLDGEGQVWIDDIKFDVVGEEIPTTGIALETIQRIAEDNAKKKKPQRKRGTKERKC
jgi:TIR domain